MKTREDVRSRLRAVASFAPVISHSYSSLHLRDDVDERVEKKKSHAKKAHSIVHGSFFITSCHTGNQRDEYKAAYLFFISTLPLSTLFRRSTVAIRLNSLRVFFALFFLTFSFKF